jgi:hypothetical protein
MAKKRFSDDDINTLAGSVFFQKPTPPPASKRKLTDTPPPSEERPQDEPTVEPAPEAEPVRSYERTYVRNTNKRHKTRYAFEFYEDQLESLQQFRLQELSAGEKGNMSAMVRDALDDYINKRRGNK